MVGGDLLVVDEKAPRDSSLLYECVHIQTLLNTYI